MVKTLFARSSILVIVTIVFLTQIQVKSYFHAGVPYTHDGENHIARFANYKVALKEGQFPPRFAPNLMNHYGYPVFNYNYPLANILSVPFSFLKVPYSLTFKVLVTTSIVGGLIGVWLWLSQLKFSFSGKIMGLFLWGTAPYVVTAIVYRGSIGEVMGLSLLPWLLWVVESLRYRTLKVNWGLMVDVTLLTAFGLVHNVTTVFGIPLILAYAALRLTTKSDWIKLGIRLGLATALSLWFWLPALAEKSEIVLDNASLSQNFVDHFPTLNQLLFSPLAFGFSYPGAIDSVSMAVGLAQLAVLIISTIWLLKLRLTKVEKGFIWIAGFLVVGWLLFLFQLKLTLPVWQILPVVRFIQFPWRLSLFLMPVTALAGAWVWPKMGDMGRWLLFVVICLQLVVMTRVTPVDYVYKTNADYEAFAQSTTTLNENLPQTFTYLEIGDWQPTASLLSGDGEIKIDRWSGSSRQYMVKATTPVTVVEPTMKFSGWQTIVESAALPQQITYIDDDQIKGRLAYHLEPGEYRVKSSFTQSTWPRRIGNIVSGLTFAGLMGSVAWLVLDQYRKGRHG